MKYEIWKTINGVEYFHGRYDITKTFDARSFAFAIEELDDCEIEWTVKKCEEF